MAKYRVVEYENGRFYAEFSMEVTKEDTSGFKSVTHNWNPIMNQSRASIEEAKSDIARHRKRTTIKKIHAIED